MRRFRGALSEYDELLLGKAYDWPNGLVKLEQPSLARTGGRRSGQKQRFVQSEQDLKLWSFRPMGDGLTALRELQKTLELNFTSSQS